MELSTPLRVMDHDDQYTVCINAFRPPLNGGQHDLDFLLGDVYMRNVYTVYVPLPLSHRFLSPGLLTHTPT